VQYLRQTVALLALGSIALYYTWDLRREPRTTAHPAQPEMEVAAAAVRVRVPERLEFNGELRPLQTQVVAQLGGQIAELSVRPGDVVAAGTMVGRIASRDLAGRFAHQQAALESARESLLEHQSESDAAVTRLARTRELFARDLIARRDVDEAELAVATARAETELAGAHVRQQEALLGQVQALQRLTRLTAPASGKVSGVLAASGTIVERGRAIMTIDTVAALKFIAVTSRTLPDLQPGLTVRVSTVALPGLVTDGQIVHAGNQENADAGGSTVAIRVDNPQGTLQPGMAARAVLNLPSTDEELLIPRAAVLATGTGYFVYKIVGTSAVRQRVRLGTERHNDVVVLHGLREGERVALEPLTINEGIRVRPRTD
jgi:membrane fusion protein (multidrug efflux system)